MVREHIQLRINGRLHRVSGDDGFLSLSDFLRQRLALTGTKIVCSEGDCGACTVLVARPGAHDDDAPTYHPLDACITWMFQLDCAHVISVEGLAEDGKLHPVQQAMVDCHGSQCGFCTPGFVMAMAGLIENADGRKQGPIDRADLCEGLSGNLCRCTGYVQIIDAARSIDPSAVASLTKRYPGCGMPGEGNSNSAAVRIKGSGGREICIPSSLSEALTFLQEHPAAKIVSGATDVGVHLNKGLVTLGKVLYIGGLKELGAIRTGDETITVGATATWAQVMDALESQLPSFTDILSHFGAPQIRNAGTIGGNIVNASPIADCLPLLFVSDARLRLISAGGERRIPIADFHLGYKKLDLKPGELLADVEFTLPTSSEHLRLYKVSRRRDLDISTFTAAIVLKLSDDRIESARIAYGGVGPVVLRLPGTEAMLKGRQLSEELMREAGLLACEEIAPISDVRASADYRLALAQTILMKAYHEIASPPMDASFKD